MGDSSMIDSFVLFAPFALLAVVALLGFVGCGPPFETGPGDPDPDPDPEPVTVKFEQLAETVETIPGSSSVSATFLPDLVVVGYTVIVWVWYNSVERSVASVQDSGENAYTRLVGPTIGPDVLAGWQQEIWYANLTNVDEGTSLTVTAEFTGPFDGEKAIGAHAYGSSPDVLEPGEVDQHVGTGAEVSAGTTDSPHDLVFGAALFSDSGQEGEGFTKRSSLKNNVTEDRIDADGGLDVAFTNLQVPGAWIAQMVTFDVITEDDG